MAFKLSISCVTVFLLSLLLALEARAVSLTIAGPTSGPVTSGTGLEVVPSGASQVTITIGLDSATLLNGYDVTIAWDPTEVSLAGSSQLYPDSQAPGSIPFTVAPDPLASGGSRVATISLTAFETTALFRLTFDVVSLLQDGGPDVRFFVDAATNGAGLAPGNVVLANPSGAGIDLAPAAVPEPMSGALAAAGVPLLLATRRRGRRRKRGDPK